MFGYSLPMKYGLMFFVLLFGFVNAQFSGLVVDATGLPLLAHMAPTITSEDGTLVYPTGFELNYALVNDIGTAALYRKLELALQDTARVGNKPLVIKAIGLTANGVLVSRDAAAAIRSSFAGSSALQNFKVIMVSDRLH